MTPRNVITYVPVISTKQDTPNGVAYTSGPTQAIGTTSYLGSIASDDVKRKRPTPALTKQVSRRNGFKVYHKLLPKAFSFTKRVQVNCTGRLEYALSSNPDAYPRYVQAGNTFPGGYPQVTQNPSPVVEQVMKRVKSKLFKRLRQSELDLAITLAEGSKTVVMIAHRAKILLKLKSFLKGFWKRVRGLSIKKHQSIAVSISQAWLEFAYGWRQLAQDIFAISSWTSSIGRSAFIKVRAGLDEDRRTVHTDPQSNILINQVESISCRGEMRIKFRIIAEPAVDLSRLASLNPFAIAWELLPFSFVFDWLYNISNYLSELQTAVTFSSYVESGYQNFTTMNVMKTSIPPQKPNGSSLAITILQEWRGSDTYVRKDRTIITDMPFPNFPVLKCPISIEHALTTLTLITSRLSASQLGRRAVYQ